MHARFADTRNIHSRDTPSVTQTATKVMAFKVLFCSLVLLLVSLLHFATYAFSTSSVAATAEVGKAFEEAEALLNWKASLDNQNKSLLSSWVGDRPCINWVGITCNDMELGATRLNLSSFGLKGTLYNL